MKALQLLLQDGPLTPGDLAARLNLTSGAVTSVLDRLERREMIRRQTPVLFRLMFTKQLENYAAVEGTSKYRAFADGRRTYVLTAAAKA